MSSEDITINGNAYDPETVTQGIQVLSANARGLTPETGSGLGGADVTSDGSINRWAGQQYGGSRDIYQVLGYPDLDDNTALERYRQRYNRQDIAERVVDIFPEETWKKPPEIIDEADDDTEFERLANSLIQTELTNYWRRLDRAQRLGEYGVMMIGFDDGQPLEEPVNNVSGPDDISFYNIFPQEQVENWQAGKDLEQGQDESDPSHPRYNKPVYYTLDFGDIDADSTDDDFKQVHWTRVIHVAEGSLETDLKGRPALKPIFNRLMDREKVIGASAEMFYTGADRKIIANVTEDFALPQYEDSAERQNFKEDLSRLINDLQQTMVGTGMDFEVLGGQEVDPSGVVDQIDASIAANTGIPKNKLQGNEMGERSTAQDRLNWFDTIQSRQTNLGLPKFVRQTIDRLIRFGGLPDPVGEDYNARFPDLFEQTESDKTENQNRRASMLQASGLGMTLSTEQKLDFIQDGPEAVEMDDQPPELPVNEEHPDVQDAFHSFNQTDVSENQRYSEGDVVDTPDGLGVVSEIRTEDFDGTEGEIEASEDSPVYVVATEDEDSPVGFFTASELSASEFPEIDAENPEGDLAENTAATLDRLLGLLSRNQEGFFEWPESWVESDTPARVIALRAWANMGGRHGGGSPGVGCTSTMRGKIADPDRFCADFKDRILGWEGWRQ